MEINPRSANPPDNGNISGGQTSTGSSASSFKSALSNATLNDRRADGSGASGGLQTSLSAIVDYLQDSFVTTQNARTGLPETTSAERGQLQNAASKMGIDEGKAKSIDGFMKSVMDQSLTSVAVQQAEAKQGAAPTSAALKTSLLQLRPEESITFTRSVAGTAKSEFIGVPNAFPASEAVQARAPGITTAWVSPSATYAQESAVTVSRDTEGGLSIEFAKGHDLSAAAELGTFPFWQDDSFAEAPQDKQTSTAYGFFYGGGNLSLGGAHNTSYSFEIQPDHEDAALSQLVNGELNLDTLTDYAKSARATAPSQVNEGSEDLEAVGSEQTSYTKTTITAPAKVSLGGNIGGGLGVTPSKTIVPDQYALDVWVWPNLTGSASSDLATRTSVEKPGEETQVDWRGPSSVDLTGTVTPVSFVLGHHVPKEGKEQFADDFWMLQYPISVSATGSSSVAVAAERGDEGQSQFEVNMDNPDSAFINQKLDEVGMTDPSTRDQVLHDATGPNKTIKMQFEAPPAPEGIGLQQEDVPAGNYRLKSISVSESKTTSASPLTLNPLSGNFDAVFLKKADQGSVETKSNVAFIEIDRGRATITYAGGMVSKPDEEVMSSELDQRSATLRHRSVAGAPGSSSR